MSRPVTRDMSCVLQLGTVIVSWTAEGVSWNPDVADDMTARTIQLLREALAEAVNHGMLVSSDEVLAETGVDEDGE